MDKNLIPASASGASRLHPRPLLRRPARTRALPQTARGFTLTELMIALVLVLLLTLAVTQIFIVTSSAIGKGQATGEVVRGLDAARVALQMDFAGTDNIAYLGFNDESGILPLSRQPAIIISSTSVPAFVSQRDMEGDQEGDPTTVDSNGDGTDDFAVGPYQIGGRWFRTDSLSFFATGEFASQTNLRPGTGFGYGDTTSNEAWIWYGHARVYDGSGVLNDDTAYFTPGEGSRQSNPHNFFASQFILLRTPILLKAPYDHDTDAATFDTLTTDSGGAGNEILFIRRTWSTPENLVTNEPEVGPLAYESEVKFFDPGHPAAVEDHRAEPAPPAPNAYVIEDSRVDVAGVSATEYRRRMALAQASGLPGNEANRPLRFDSGSFPSVPTWYNRLFARTTKNAENQNVGRFWINPLVLKPLNAGEISQSTGYLLGGASQFIVEYAGDFLKQDLDDGELDWSAGSPLVPDGVIDFTIDASGVRHIRWYGMPRDVDGDAAIPGPALAPAGASAATDPALLQSTDVRPLADYLPRAAAAGVTNMTVDTGFPFEKRLPAQYTGDPETLQTRTGIENYIDPDLYTAAFDWSYLAAWGPHDFDGDFYGTGGTTVSEHQDAALTGVPLRPAMIRVIITAIDRQAKLETPVSQELVFRVPQQ